MGHITDGTAQAYLDGELPPAERAEVGRHILECRACKRQLEALRAASDRFARAMRRLDRPAPVDEARNAVSRRTGRGRMADTRRTLMRAAVAVLVASAVVASALPGSPVREWAVAAWDQATAWFDEEADPAAPAVTRPAPEPAAGLSVAPVDGRIRIEWANPAEGSRLRVRLVEAERALVRAAGGASSARFRTGPGSIRLVGGGRGTLSIALPRGLDRAVVAVDGRPYVIKENGRLRFPTARPVERTGAGVVFRLRP